MTLVTKRVVGPKRSRAAVAVSSLRLEAGTRGPLAPRAYTTAPPSATARHDAWRAPARPGSARTVSREASRRSVAIVRASKDGTRRADSTGLCRRTAALPAACEVGSGDVKAMEAEVTATTARRIGATQR